MSLIVCGILIATQKPPASPSKMTGPELKTITVENIESD
jgi:hypothetical protein